MIKVKHIQMVLICLLACTGWSNAQENLRQRVKGERGLSHQVVRFNAEEKIFFQPNNLASTLGLDQQCDFKLIRQESDGIGQNFRYIQTIQGIPVENSMYIVQTQNGAARVMSGSIIVEPDPATSDRIAASLSPDKAVSAALKFVGAQRYAWQDAGMEQQLKIQGQPSNKPTAELVWYNQGDVLDARGLQLAYKIVVYAIEPLSRAAYFINANNGKLLGKKDMLYYTDATGTAATVYSGTQNIHSDLNGSSYRLRDLTKGSGVITLHGENGTHADYTSTTSNWSYTTNDKYALDAHYGVSQTWLFYNTNFGRNSVNNSGLALTSYVNETSTTDNAYWDGSIMHYGVRSSGGAGITAIDVTGHELTHGVTQYTSNLNYSNESGAMNESMSDIFGKSVQFWSKPNDVNWLLSNDMNWAIRNMANPKAYSQPNTYQGTYWYTGTADNGGVHTNSGVGNYFFYLLVTGGSGTNDKGNSYTVSGLGLSTADSIIYRSETVYLTPTSNYSAWRTACINAATDLYGASSNQVAQVQNAWYAVGIGTAAGGTGSCSAPGGLAAGSLANTSATLSWTSSGATSYNLQWKASSASTWTTVSGLTTTSYALTGLTACTAYQFQVQGVCSATSSSAYSTAFSFSTTGCAVSPYCASKGTSTSFEYINKIAIGSISNVSGNNNGYADFTAQNTNLAGGAAASITMTPGFSSGSYREYWTVYIDYNHNGVFTDAGEKVTTGNGTAAVTKSFTVPTTALNGPTRMRVQMSYGSAAATSCSTISYGEVEDYTITVTGNAAFSMNTVQASTSKESYLYPNPATDQTILNLVADAASSETIKVYNAAGQLVLNTTAELLEGVNAITLNTTQLPQGIYTIKAEGSVNATLRLVVNK